jgi:PAS domain S-box-containing protein
MTGGSRGMEYLSEEEKRGSLIKQAAMLCLLVLLSIGLIYLGQTYYRPFHIGVEAFSSFIAFSILLIALNTHEISKNIPFLFLGIAYGFAGGFNIIHIISSNGMGFFPGETTNLSMIFSIVPRFIIAISILICCRLFYKSYKAITPFTIIICFSVFSAAILVLVFLVDKFPVCYVPGYGSTPFKILIEYFISLILIISIVVLFKAKKYIEANVFLLLQLYLYINIVCNILLTLYTVQQEMTNVLAHILRLYSFYCIYRAIVKVGLKTPYKLLFNEISQKDDSLKLKDSELRQTVHELQKENELRKNVEEIFFKNEACYKLLIENSQDTIIIYDDERIVFANESASILFGVDAPEKLLGKEIAEFFKLNTHQTVLQTINKKCNEKVIIPAYETQITGINGKTTYVEVTSAYVIYQSKPAMMNLMRDISSRKQFEKMEKAVEKDRKLLNETLEFNRLITEFFSNISHELRTPLNVILSAVQVLGLEEQKHPYGEMEEKRSKYMKIIKQNSYRLLRLINNLIDISKFDSGYVTLHLENHNIVNIVEEITLSVVEYIENKGVKFTFDTNVEEKILACDPDKIERIMMNLLSNAAKFTNAGDEINVEIIDQEDNIQISVRDTGIGIPEDKLKVIFERFRQVDNSLSRSHEGSGIGLSLVKALVEMHGGSISVKSSLDQGSEFIINIPVKLSDGSLVFQNNMLYNDNTERVNIEFSDL